jgi:hypothetical protein
VGEGGQIPGVMWSSARVVKNLGEVSIIYIVPVRLYKQTIFISLFLLARSSDLIL